MGVRVANQRQLGPLTMSTDLSVTAPLEITTDVPRFQPGGVNGPLGVGLDQAVSASSLDGAAQEGLESRFFKSRCSAFWRVV